MTRKRVSKKSKKSWRKFSNVKDIEEHLEQLRAEERTGLVTFLFVESPYVSN